MKAFSKYHPVFKRTTKNKILFLHITAKVNEKTPVPAICMFHSHGRGCGAYCFTRWCTLIFTSSHRKFSFKVHLQWHKDAEDVTCTICTPISSPRELLYWSEKYVNCSWCYMEKQSICKWFLILSDIICLSNE